MKNNRMVTSISLAGFVLCFFALSLIIKYVCSELDTDSFNKNKDRIFAVYNTPRVTWVNYELTEIIKNSPQFSKVIPYCPYERKSYLKFKDNEAIESKVIFVDSTFFDAFSFDFIAGDKGECLTTPFSAVLTESEARLLFGKANPVGGKIKFNSADEITITGIIKDYPKNSIFTSKCFISFSTLKTLAESSLNCGWNCANIKAFVMLQSPDKKEAAVEEIKRIIHKNRNDDSDVAAELVSLHDFYFDKRIEVPEQMNKGSMNSVVIFIFLGVLIFVITLFNYFNLSVASLIEKKKENAILKIFGSNFYQQWLLLFVDTLVLTATSFLLSLFIQNVFMTTEYGNMISSLGKVSSWMSLVIIPLIIVVVISFFASIAGAFYIKNRSLTDIYKSSEGRGKGRFQMIILMAQLSIVTFLIGSTLIVSKQVNFLQKTDPGFDKENLICIETPSGMEKPSKVLKSEFSSIPGVLNVTFSDAIPGTKTQHWGQIIEVDGKNRNIDFDVVPVWPDFLSTYGFKLKEGRLFYDNEPSDCNNLIINESALRSFGLKNPLGQTVSKGKIVGVVSDSYFQSLHSMITPMVFINNPRNYGYMTIKTEKGLENQKSVLDKVRSKWTALEPDFPFEYFYFDQHLDQEYHREIEFRRLILFLSVISIINTGLGLIGVSFFIARKNTKEIGIRRVNGATVYEMVRWLNSRFYISLIISLLITVPALWWFMSLWLQAFSYKTALSWWVFALSCFVTAVVSVACISMQSWRAATRNPVEALKYE